MAAVWFADEPSATAAAKCSRGTSDGRSAEEAGDEKPRAAQVLPPGHEPQLLRHTVTLTISLARVDDDLLQVQPVLRACPSQDFRGSLGGVAVAHCRFFKRPTDIWWEQGWLPAAGRSLAERYSAYKFAVASILTNSQSNKVIQIIVRPSILEHWTLQPRSSIKGIELFRSPDTEITHSFVRCSAIHGGE